MLSAQLFAAADEAKRMEDKLNYTLQQEEYLMRKVAELEEENSKLKDKFKYISQLFETAAKVLAED